MRLAGDRAGAMGYIPTPYTAVSTWLRDHGYEPGSPAWIRVEAVVAGMDEVHCARNEREGNRSDDGN